MVTSGKVYFLHGTFSTETNIRSLIIITNMKSSILSIILTMTLTLLSSQDEEQEINEGHLYQEERDRKENLWKVLGEDPDKAYTNCFGNP